MGNSRSADLAHHATAREEDAFTVPMDLRSPELRVYQKEWLGQSGERSCDICDPPQATEGTIPSDEKCACARFTTEYNISGPAVLELASRLRLRFPLPKDTEANRLAVYREACAIVREETKFGGKWVGMRAVHQQRLQVFAVNWVFLPTDDDIRVAEMRRSSAWKQRQREYETGRSCLPVWRCRRRPQEN